jgi:D-alanyl-D-alanine carboxypeptidase
MEELFYGMMLPSGNDAAVAISEIVGLLSFLKFRNKQIDPYSSDWFKPYLNKNCSYIFIGMMNERCQKMGTVDTRFFNSHGNDAYEQVKNTSTCNEIARLSS